MPLRGDINIMEDTWQADQAISKYRVVTYSSTQGFVTLGTAKAAGIAGVIQNATTASGDTVRVRQLGKSLVVISAAVTKGVPLILSDSQGRVSNLGGATGDGIVGVSEEGGAGSAGTSGDTITCFLQIRRA
jgi:hypothetical protein